MTDRDHLSLLDGARPRGRRPTACSSSTTRAYATLLAPFAPRRSRTLIDEPDDLYVLFFTSGTTGAPKARPVTQGRLMRAGDGAARAGST